MKTTRTRRSLFGGALRFAVLAATAALSTSATADFMPTADPAPDAVPNHTVIYALDSSGIVVVDEISFNYTGGFADELFSSSPSGSNEITATAGPSEMLAEAFVSDAAEWNEAGAIVVQYFTVDHAKVAYVYWDLLAANADARVELYQEGFGFLLHEDGASAGEVSFTLQAGMVYEFIAWASLDGAGHVYAGIRWEPIPSPGAFAVLSLCMVVAHRRRRS